MKVQGKFICFVENGARLYPVEGVRPNIDFDNAIVEIESPNKKLKEQQQASNCEWYNKGLDAQKNIDERNELTEDEIEKIIGSVEGCNTDYTIYIKNIARAISTRLKGKE